NYFRQMAPWFLFFGGHPVDNPEQVMQELNDAFKLVENSSRKAQAARPQIEAIRQQVSRFNTLEENNRIIAEAKALEKQLGIIYPWDPEFPVILKRNADMILFGLTVQRDGVKFSLMDIGSNKGFVALVAWLKAIGCTVEYRIVADEA